MQAQVIDTKSPDSFLNIVINYLETHSYTVFFTTTPLSAAQQDLDTQQHPANGWNYDAEESFPFAMHTDLKRDLYAHLRASNDSTGQGGPPLFEKYNFLSPGKYLRSIRAPCSRNHGICSINWHSCPRTSVQDFVQLSTVLIFYRYFHGRFRDPHPTLHSICRNKRYRRLGGILRCIHKGDGCYRADEQTAMKRLAVCMYDFSIL